jgi:hypothetical protein
MPGARPCSPSLDGRPQRLRGLDELGIARREVRYFMDTFVASFRLTLESSSELVLTY